MLAAAQRLQYPAGLLAAAAAQFRHNDRSRKPLNHLMRVTLKKSFIGPREPILRKNTDYFKKR